MLKGTAVWNEMTVPDGSENVSLRPLEYSDCPDAPFVPSWTGWDETGNRAEQDSRSTSDGRMQEERIATAENERQRAEETRRSFEAGWAQGMEEGRKVEHAAQADAVVEANAQRTRQAAELIERFAQERDRYFHAAEPEVVRLALAVARRILRREAERDPLLLMGAVRAALGQILGSTEVRLRVPAADLDLWTEGINLLPHLSVKPKIEAGVDMQLGDCVIETDLGTADLGMHAQLGEIERVLLGNSDSSAACAEPAA